MTQSAIDLSKTPLHLPSVGIPDPGAELLLDFNFDGPAFENYIKTHCSAECPGRIIMIESSANDRDSWECHPLGDEIVIIWHPADVSVPIKAVYITPAPDTRRKPRD